MLALFNRRPILTALLIVMLDMLLAVLLTLAAQAFIPNIEPDFIALCVLTLIVVVVLTGLGWWRSIGFNPPAEWRDLRLLLLPAIIIIVPPLLGGIKPVEPASLAYLLLAYALVGLREEALHRGMLLRILQPLGPRRAVLISGLLFGLAHLSNLVARSNPVIVFAQAVGAFCDGVGFAALRLRTNTLWFLVVLHALHDLLLRYTRLPAIPLDVAQVTLLLFYGLYLMRNPKPLQTTPILSP